MPFAAGDVIAERYQLQRRLGINGPRETWLIHDLQQGCAWVLKLLYFGGDTQWQELKLLEREAETLQSLHHPAIPHHSTAFWSERLEGHYFCLLQQYIPGITLAEQLHRGVRYDPNELERLIISMLNVLEYLHSQSPSVVHRDIKPSNILIGEDGAFYLIDFGAVQAKASGRGTITVVGTFGYMPPEQFAAQSLPASDLYALGATLVHLISGVDPVDLPREGLRMQFAGRINLDKGWQIWLERMVEPELEWRWSSASEALDQFKERDGLPSSEAFEQLLELGETGTSQSVDIHQKKYPLWKLTAMGGMYTFMVLAVLMSTFIVQKILRIDNSQLTVIAGFLISSLIIGVIAEACNYRGSNRQ
ncbi:MAG: serine/threonine protein kinase [Anaerolineae bacterium]|nr:serine/threonine protein kinase [Gloeobacterales cyanobacterium ES-bin-313]